MKKNTQLWSALSFAWELGYIIAIPIAAFGFGGAFLDKKYGTSPLFIFIGFFLSIIISSIGIYRKAKIIISEAEKKTPQSKP